MIKGFIKLNSLTNNISLLLFLFCVFGTTSVHTAKGELRFSTYYDSNMLESVTEKTATWGIKLRSKLNHQFILGRTIISGGMLAQAYYNPTYPTESKLVIKSQGAARLQLRYNLTNISSFSHFQKTFPDQEKAFTQTGISSSLYYSVSSRLTSRIVIKYHWLQYDLPETFRFNIFDAEVGSEYLSGHKITWEGMFSITRVSHKDLAVVELVNDSLIRIISELQSDRALRGTLHVKYQENIILGMRLTGESNRSNSLINSFSAVNLQVYLSGSLAEKTYYHLFINYIHKRYEHSTATYFGDLRDPENQQQNRIYIRLEHFLRNNSIVFLQLNLLKNETIYNAIYYEKTLFELGIKYLL